MPNLIDMIVRHSVYLEKVKNWYEADFITYLQKLRAQLRELIEKLDVSSFDQLTKRAYNKLITTLEQIQAKFYGDYGSRLLGSLRELANVDFALQRGIFSAAKAKLTELSASTMWARIKSTPVAAFAAGPKESLESFVATAKRYVELAVKQGYLDAKKKAEVLADVVGTAVNRFKDGALNKVVNAAGGMLDTITQHVSSVISDTYADEVSDCYVWISVIDSRTTDICRGRNGNVYRRGAGPLPPAHPRCRSRTAPCECGSDVIVPGFKTWLKKQSDAFVRNAFGRQAADDVQAGKGMDAYGDYKILDRMSPKQLADTLALITTD